MASRVSCKALAMAAMWMASLSAPALAQDAGEAAATARWVTLGTRGGPVASDTRSQPANLLVVYGGAMAFRAGVGALVVTHFVGLEPEEDGHLAYLRTIADSYDGPTVIANDLERF